MRYSIKPRTRKYVKRYGLLSFVRNFSNIYKKFIGYRTRCFKNWFQKIVHKVAETIGEFIRNNIADAVAKSNDVKIVNAKPADEVIIPPEKKRKNIEQIETIIPKMEYCKISKLLKDSWVSKFVTKKRSIFWQQKYKLNLIFQY